MKSGARPRVSWGAAANATSYEVYFGPGPTLPRIGVTAGTTLSVSIAPHTTYRWYVVAVNALGEAIGPLWSFTTR